MKHSIPPSPPPLPTVDALLAYGRARSLAMTLETFPPWSFRAFQRLIRLAKIAWLNALALWIVLTVSSIGLPRSLAVILSGALAMTLATAVVSTFLSALINLTSAWEADRFADHPAGTIEARRALIEAACDHHRIVDVGFQAWREYAYAHQAHQRTRGYRTAAGETDLDSVLNDIASLKRHAHIWGWSDQRATYSRHKLDFFYAEFYGKQTTSR